MSDKILIRLEWKNQDFFEVTSKKNDEAPIQILRIEENGCLETLWEHQAAYAKKYFSGLIDSIGTAMKEE